MTQVVLQNLSEGSKVFHDLDSRAFTLKSGEKKAIEIAPHHVMLLERDAQKENPKVAVDMSPLERKSYEKDLDLIKKSNSNARLKGRLVVAGRVVPTRERMPKVDTRFMTDPRTVHPPLMDTMSDTTPITAKRSRSKTTKFAVPKELKTAQSEPVPEPKAKETGTKRVAMKKKG